MSGDFDSGARRAGMALCASLLQGIWGLRVGGRELIPRDGPLIAAANHSRLWDPPVLAAALAPARKPRFLAKRELFDWPLAGRFFRAAGVIALDRSGADVPALREALETLRGGGSVAIFPEGTRLRSGETRPPKPGISFLAFRARAPVLPVRLVGMDRFPRAFPIEARIGTPLSPPDSEDREAAQRFAQDVMDAVYAL